MTPELLAEIRARVVRNYNDGTSDVYEQVGCDRRDLLEYVTELEQRLRSHQSLERSVNEARALSRAQVALRERAELAERMYAETNSALMRSGRLVGEKSADVILLTERVEFLSEYKAVSDTEACLADDENDALLASLNTTEALLNEVSVRNSTQAGELFDLRARLAESEKAANQRPLHERLRLVALELVKIAEADSRVVDNAKLAAWAAQLYALSTHMALGGGE